MPHKHAGYSQHCTYTLVSMQYSVIGYLISWLDVQPLPRPPLEDSRRRDQGRIEAVPWLRGGEGCRTAPPIVPHKRFLPKSGAPPRGGNVGRAGSRRLPQEAVNAPRCESHAG